MSVRSDQETLLLRGETVSESKHQQQQQRRLMEVTVLYGRVGVPTDRFTGRTRRLQLLQLRYLPISRQPTDNTRPVNKWPLGSIFYSDGWNFFLHISQWPSGRIWPLFYKN